jgi:glycosyltransferase involved in cell wall biosynthesis
MDFFKSLIKELIDDGNVVDIATNESEKPVSQFIKDLGCKVFSIDTSRSPLSTGNIRAIKQIRNIAKDYDIVHCHTPLASIATRLACRGFRKNGLKVIYTAHGFHFYKGAPLKNWLIYYPVEKLCSHWTDILITINREDFELAKKKLKAKRIEYVPGVGIDTKKFADVVVDRDKKLEEIGVPKDAKLLLSVGELNENKNHKVVIEALSKINDPKIHYVIAGIGDQKENLENLAKTFNVNLHLLGYRKDVAELYKCADLYVLPSIREGLNVSVMEALASGLPVICSKIRGNIDMVHDGVNGYLFEPTAVNSVADSIKKVVILPKDKFVSSITSTKHDVIEINRAMRNLYFS